jgi:uracil-DNA glycosylase family 4
MIHTFTVPAFGPTPNDILFVAKAPGNEEMHANRPMVGRAGKEHRMYCERHKISPHSIRVTNLCRSYIPPQERLPAELVQAWTGDLLEEIRLTNPRLIVAVGLDPVRFFLGPSADLNTVHGIPHRQDSLGHSLPWCEDRCILPVIQPAAGFHSSDTRALIDWDYAQVARVLGLIRAGRPIDYRRDQYEGRTIYRDVTGKELADILLSSIPSVLGLDTEGTVSDPFCLQVCAEPGIAYMLRLEQADFFVGIEAIDTCAKLGTIITGHNLGMYDLEMCRRPFKLDLFDAYCHDTLFDAFLFNVEPLGLKANAWRHLGMRMKSHNETVGAMGVQDQIEYLSRVVEHTKSWGRPDPQFKLKSDGQIEIKLKPQPISTRAKKILTDIETGRHADDEEEEEEQEEELDTGEAEINGISPRKRWAMVKRDLPELAARVEAELGHMPYATMKKLWARDRDAAIQYSCADADGHRRLYDPFMVRLREEGKLDLAETYSINMHVFSEMQENGLPALRSKLVALRDQMTARMLEIVTQIAHTYNDGKPFNPKSPPQVSALLDRYGLKGVGKTKSGKMSTGKKSIEYLKFITPHMTEEEKFKRNLVVMLLNWREHQHTRDMFCKPTLESIPDYLDECTVRCSLLPWGTHTRRMAARRPNLLAQPKHSIFGKMIRGCYVAPEGYVFIESDLASIEVCVMAHESADPDLCRVLKSGVKFHKETASRLFEVPKEKVDDTQYLMAKRAIFGTFFGQTGSGLKDQLWTQGLTHYTEEMCQASIDGVKYKVYPAIGQYEKLIAALLRNPRTGGSVRDMWGMERKLPGIYSADRGIAAEAIRHAVSQKIQGGAQGLIQKAISWLKGEVRRLRVEMGIDVRWLLTVHDSLLLLCPMWAVGIVRDKIEEGLTQHCGVELLVPVRAESKVAGSWGELE